MDEEQMDIVVPAPEAVVIQEPVAAPDEPSGQSAGTVRKDS